MTPFVVVACALVGLAVGSFLNVVVHRVPRQESVLTPGSHCPGCEAPVAARDNVPVLSWLALRGRCRSCHERISARYPIVEALTAVLFVAMAVRFDASVELAAYCVLAAASVAVAAIDIDRQVVPRKVVYATVALGAPLLLIAGVVDGSPRRIVDAAIGGVAAFCFLGIVHLVSPKGMGFGDVRLAGVLGMFLGWLGLVQVLIGFFLAFLLGSVIGVVLIAAGRMARRTRVPFAPFLLSGALLTVWFGAPIARQWLG